ncbi:hypothetical protein LCGC14_3121920, partial [marine sediment metagenome]
MSETGVSIFGSKELEFVLENQEKKISEVMVAVDGVLDGLGRIKKVNDKIGMWLSQILDDPK